MLRTPLFDCHTQQKARLAEFGGWEMPIQYTGILQEHTHTRTACSIFDICHMGEFVLSGSGAESTLNNLLTQTIDTLADGQSRYGYMLNETGGVIDDVICFKLDANTFWLVVNAATIATDFSWINRHLQADTQIVDISSETAKIDIQGPTARQAMESVFQTKMPDLNYFRLTQLELDGMRVLLSRTGYTGEFGYELFLPSDAAADVWMRLCADERIEPAGLGARDTLRLEAGYALYGHELRNDLSPVAAARGMFINKTKSFIGSAPTHAALENGLPRYLAAIKLDGRQAAREGDRVLADGEEVGIVSSGTYSPSLTHAIAMAYLNADMCDEGRQLEVINSRGKQLAGQVSTLPFYTAGTARA